MTDEEYVAARTKLATRALWLIRLLRALPDEACDAWQRLEAQLADTVVALHTLIQIADDRAPWALAYIVAYDQWQTGRARAEREQEGGS